MEKGVLERLYRVISDRRDHPVENSYTCLLFKKGKDEVLKKIVEEAAEVILASKGGDRSGSIYETADLLYHLLVMMVMDGIALEDVYNELERRFGKSGLNKNS